MGEIGEAATGQQTLERLRETPWELLILDIGMPDRSGMDILRHVRSGYPDTRVLILSGFPGTCTRSTCCVQARMASLVKRARRTTS